MCYGAKLLRSDFVSQQIETQGAVGENKVAIQATPS